MSLKKNSKPKVKAKGKSKKEQGKKATTGSLSDKGIRPDPRTLERGEGSEYANSVKGVMEEARNMKGSSNSFLGVDKKIIDPKQFADSLLEDE